MDLNIIDWGLTEYADAMARQNALVARRGAGLVGDTLIFTEHRPVYTLGARPGAARNLIWRHQIREQKGIGLVQTNRGGDVTYHGPGQLVGYPIIDWSHIRDLHRYLRLLEEVMIATAGAFGLEARRREGMTGIWVENRKLAAIGVAVRQWVTYHGFAFNVAPDLHHFSGIVPCGITDGTVTSLQVELKDAAPSMDRVKEILSLEFQRIFADSLDHGNA